jgi:carbon storage regulator
MLVLSRKKNESVVINNDITVRVVEIRGDKVRLGVEAPREVPVHRREVYEAIHREDAVAHQDGGVVPGPGTPWAGKLWHNLLRVFGLSPRNSGAKGTQDSGRMEPDHPEETPARSEEDLARMEGEALARREEQEVRSRDVLLIEEDGGVSILTVP